MGLVTITSGIVGKATFQVITHPVADVPNVAVPLTSVAVAFNVVEPLPPDCATAGAVALKLVRWPANHVAVVAAIPIVVVLAP